MYETFTEAKKDCVWVRGLSSSVRDLKLHFAAPVVSWQGAHPYSRKCKVYTQFSHCIPNLSHLRRVRTLSLHMGGFISPSHIQMLSLLPIQDLSLQFRKDTEAGFENAFALPHAFAQMKWLRTLQFPAYDHRETHSCEYLKESLSRTLLDMKSFQCKRIHGGSRDEAIIYCKQ